MMELPPPLPSTAASLISLESAALGPDPTAPLLADVTLSLRPHMRLLLLGRNGAGKSTLLAGLAGVLRPSAGVREVGERWLQLAFWRQTDRALLHDDEDPLQFIARVGGGAEAAHGLELLESAGLDRFAARRPCSCLSSGERTLVALCALAVAPRHVLLLDEPGAFLV